MARAKILEPLFERLITLPGVGTKLEAQLQKVAGERLVDLLMTGPTGVIDRSERPPVARAEADKIVTLKVRVVEHRPPRNRRQPYRVLCRDETGVIALVFFRVFDDWLEKHLPPGEVRIVSGRVERYAGQLQMTHPDYIVTPGAEEDMPLVEPVYPLTKGLSLKSYGRVLRKALKRVPDLPEWLDAALMKREGWQGWATSLKALHNPGSAADAGMDAPARRRLAYDELLANQLALALMRHRMRRRKGRVNKGSGHLREKVVSALPWPLTESQRAVLSGIDADMARRTAMLRLLQGDVGSGKTIVALLAVLNGIEAGGQAAMLAPTMLLARQHYETIRPWADKAGVSIALLTGATKKAGREEILDRLRSGDLDLLVGTHAIIQERVEFKDLAIAVIDEQHRFGVHQRLAVRKKARVMPDILVMTATPIPRTLSLTVYGDMDVSRMTGKPPGRQPVETRVVKQNRLADVEMSLKRLLARGERIYWVCPMVEESESVDLAAAEDRYRALKDCYGDMVGLVHGRMKPDERMAGMRAFQQGRTPILVATTVIEVGVDVPEATTMVIEQAERFGLAQLHQLRGRVGRGADKSRCILIRAENIGDTARERLKIMRETEDGFLIAERDLELRGAGEVLGVRQSGFPEFRIADAERDGALMKMADDEAKLLIQRDSELKGPRGEALRTLLYLFERDAAVQLLASG